MIKIEINGQVYGFERETIENEFAERGIEKLKENNMEGKKTVYDSLIGSALMMMGIKKPKEYKGMDNIEFASRVAVAMLMERLDGQTIKLSAVEVPKED
jgi:hypothetical protein